MQTQHRVSLPVDLGRSSATVHTHHRHLWSLIIPKADTHRTISRKVEGVCNLQRVLISQIKYCFLIFILSTARAWFIGAGHQSAPRFSEPDDTVTWLFVVRFCHGMMRCNQTCC